MAPFAGGAAWHLGQWDTMAEYVQLLSDDSFEGSYYRSILSAFQGQQDHAQLHLTMARGFLVAELRATLSESYGRAYRSLVRCQQLSEVEEVIDYQRAKQEGNIDRQEIIKLTWTKRLYGMQRYAILSLPCSFFIQGQIISLHISSFLQHRNVEIWQDVLEIRSLVLSPLEDRQNWLRFAR